MCNTESIVFEEMRHDCTCTEMSNETNVDNQKGVYVLTDSAFRPFGRMSMAVRSEAISMAQAVSIIPFA